MTLKELTNIDYEMDLFFVTDGVVKKGNIFSVFYLGQEVMGAKILSDDNVYELGANDIYTTNDDQRMIDKLVEGINHKI